ncbi:kinase-like protein [Glonium stellatum]|uniref:Kinase-like protein n=1 Tax=Glonium stellatum TaxID=574774 RepID=A0A8E2JUA1_9PEZI|nr:kinase-like protein [Glonium stellatum]
MAMAQVCPQADFLQDTTPLEAASSTSYSQEQDPGPIVHPNALEIAMSRLFTRLEDLNRNFTDQDIEDIKDILFKAGKKDWSVRPRTYAVLRMIGKVDLMDAFVEQNLFDIKFPYVSLTIPLIVKNIGLRLKFLQNQKLVLTDAKDMESGAHAHLAVDAGSHFVTFRLLGRGAFGDVERVGSNLSLKDYARKWIIRRKKFDSSEANEIAFRNKVGHLKKFSHQHLVKYIGSYTDPRFFGLLILPIADCDLREYLSRDPFPESDLNHLRHFYGYITSAVTYLHRNACRHKDLKPGNILVRRGEVYVTDFGLALDWSEATKSVTEGPPGTVSIVYAAPEVMKEEPRGSSSSM